MEALWNYQVQLANVQPHLSFHKSLSEYRHQDTTANNTGGAPTDTTATTATTTTTTTKKYKWQTAADTAYKFNPATAYSRSELVNIEWKTEAKGVDRSERGAGGVFFVETSKGTVVIKASRSIAPELFGSFLCFKLGVLAPKSRLLKTESTEGIELLNTLKSLDPSWRVITNLFDQVFLLVQDYIPGFSLSSLDYYTAEKIFGSEISDTLTQEEAERHKQLGRMLAVDVLLNNGDRLPLIWNNSGNTSNIMVFKSSDSFNIVSIDARLCCIQENLSVSYFSKVTNLVSKLKQLGAFSRDTNSDADKTAILPEFTNIQQRLISVLGIDIGSKGAHAIQAGFCETLVKCKTEIQDIKDSLTNWHTSFSEIDTQLNTLDLHNIKLSFVFSLLDTIVQAME